MYMNIVTVKKKLITCPHCRNEQSILLAVPDEPDGPKNKQTVRCVICAIEFDLLIEAKIVDGPFEA